VVITAARQPGGLTRKHKLRPKQHCLLPRTVRQVGAAKAVRKTELPRFRERWQSQENSGWGEPLAGDRLDTGDFGRCNTWIADKKLVK
jgi:hypothetical protein